MGAQALSHELSAYESKCANKPLPSDLTISPKPMRKKRLALYAIGALLIIIFASIFIYPLFIPKKLQVTFSDDKILIGDGNGPYTSGSEGIDLISVHRLPDENAFSFQSYASSTRSIFIKFENAKWNDRNLTDILPQLPSKNYRVILTCGHRTILLDTMDVGESLSPYIWLTLYEADTGNMLSNFLIRDLVPFDNMTLPQEPLSWLYEQGHAVLTRHSQDAWILDVDAWFTDFTSPTGVILPNTPKCYVRISFVMTINFKA